MTRDYDDPPRPSDLEPLAMEYRGAAEPAVPVDLPKVTLRAARRLCFAVGLALLAGGYGSSLPGYEAGTMMGWGGFLAGLCVPLGRWSQE